MDNTQEDISLEDVMGAGTRKLAKPTTQAKTIKELYGSIGLQGETSRARCLAGRVGRWWRRGTMGSRYMGSGINKGFFLVTLHVISVHRLQPLHHVPNEPSAHGLL